MKQNPHKARTHAYAKVSGPRIDLHSQRSVEGLSIRLVFKLPIWPKQQHAAKMRNTLFHISIHHM